MECRIGMASYRGISRRSFVASAGPLGVAAAMRRRQRVRAADRPTVTVWTWQDSAGVAALAAVASSFNASQDEVAVEVVRRPDVISTFQLVLTIRDGQGPDLCVGGRGLLAERDALGIFQDLAPSLANLDPGFALDRDTQPIAAQEVRLGDRLVGVPLETSVRVLAFNRSLLADAGVDLTEWDPARGPVTFDRLAEVARTLDRTDGSGAYERLGFLPSFGEGSPYTYLHAWGASYWDSGQCAFTVDTPEARAAIGWVRDDLKHFDESNLDAFVMRNGGVTVPTCAAFLAGEIAFALVRGEDLRAIAQAAPGIDLGATFVPVPAAGASSRSWATGSAISLMTGATQPAGAARFVAYLTREDVLDRYCLALGSLPSRTVISPDVVKGLALPSFIPDEVLPNAVPTPPVPVATQFQDLLFGAWTDLVLGRTDLDAGLASLQADAEQSLADAPVTCA